MYKPAQKQIDDEIEKLKDLRQKVICYSAFGDDNRAQITAQIMVLVNDLDSADIADRYACDGTSEEIYSAACDARKWLDGECGLDTLSEGWEELRQ